MKFLDKLALKIFSLIIFVLGIGIILVLTGVMPLEAIVNDLTQLARVKYSSEKTKAESFIQILKCRADSPKLLINEDSKALLKYCSQSNLNSTGTSFSETLAEHKISPLKGLSSRSRLIVTNVFSQSSKSTQYLPQILIVLRLNGSGLICFLKKRPLKSFS